MLLTRQLRRWARALSATHCAVPRTACGLAALRALSSHAPRGIALGDRVSLSFAVCEQGQSAVLDASEGAVVVVGRNAQLPPALDAGLVGKAAGDSLQVVVPCTEGFGPVRSDLVVRVERRRLPAECAVGGLVTVREPDSERELVGRVIALDSDTATLDLNHPLAGKHLSIQATILAVGEQIGRVELETLVPGDGETVPVDHDTVVCHYKCFRPGGTKVLESSEDKGPASFVLGCGEVIPGWEDAVRQMSVGQVAKVVVPSHLAYGRAGFGPVPPNSDLVFELRLCEVLRHSPHTNSE